MLPVSPESLSVILGGLGLRELGQGNADPVASVLLCVIKSFVLTQESDTFSPASIQEPTAGYLYDIITFTVLAISMETLTKACLSGRGKIEALLDRL